MGKLVCRDRYCAIVSLPIVNVASIVIIIFQIRFVVTDRAAYVLNSWSPLQQNLNHASVSFKLLRLLNNEYLINKMQASMCDY